ncbi:uncharacterized protein TNIN_380541 [Trichonephila inaurata madagascariensis]|uniref:Uncharacterized protein n=1 Tax=Trichonephila inaurata madagascariensis TaxID=2747483 RepID=A0A8X6IAI0_9ARAC|nr:uncharacterized protein TNIN_380541 [Trichonephila inaurata madagascariensis]
MLLLGFWNKRYCVYLANFTSRTDTKCTAMKFLVVCLIVLVTITTCHASSFSMSCSTGPDGRMKCVQQSDPNGNYAGAFANTNRMGSQMLAQAGVPGYFKYNYANMKYV